MEWLIVPLLAVAIAYWVALPLLRGRAAGDRGPDPDVAEASARRDAALDALVDLDDERAIGKLSEADFDALRAAYEREALNALRELDALSGRDPLEDEIAAMRKEMTCPSCGALRRPGDPCARCGSPA